VLDVALVSSHRWLADEAAMTRWRSCSKLVSALMDRNSFWPSRSFARASRRPAESCESMRSSSIAVGRSGTHRHQQTRSSPGGSTEEASRFSEAPPCSPPRTASEEERRAQQVILLYWVLTIWAATTAPAGSSGITLGQRRLARAHVARDDHKALALAHPIAGRRARACGSGFEEESDPGSV